MIFPALRPGSTQCLSASCLHLLQGGRWPALPGQQVQDREISQARFHLIEPSHWWSAIRCGLFVGTGWRFRLPHGPFFVIG